MRTSPYLLYAFILCALSACKGIYEPNALNMPLLEERREYTVTVSHKNVQAAYAVNNHIGVMANAFYTNMPVGKQIGYKEAQEGGRGFLLEGGVGYFRYVPDLDLTLETYSGIGFGNTLFKYIVYDNDGKAINQTFSSNGLRYFIQPDIGFKSKYFDWALGTRLSAVEFLNPTITNAQANLPNNRYSSAGSTTYFFMEPAITVRFGYKIAKVQLQYCHSVKLNNAPLYYNDYLFNAGLFFNFNNAKYKGAHLPWFPKKTKKGEERKG